MNSVYQVHTNGLGYAGSHSSESAAIAAADALAESSGFRRWVLVVAVDWDDRGLLWETERRIYLRHAS